MTTPFRFSFSDIPILHDESLVIPGEPIKVKRTWVERLLFFPWRPWVREKTVYPMVPDPNYLIVDLAGQRPVLIAHPETAKLLKGIMRHKS